jgi:hypothetical protein
MELVEIAGLRPNNWFLDRVKLDAIRQVWKKCQEKTLPPISVAVIDGQLSLLDGHCRAYVALENGQRQIPVVIEDLSSFEAPRNLREYFHRQGPLIGIRHVPDLGKRIV